MADQGRTIEQASERLQAIEAANLVEDFSRIQRQTKEAFASVDKLLALMQRSKAAPKRTIRLLQEAMKDARAEAFAGFERMRR